MSGDADEVVLEIENIPLTCKRQELTRNSDYFRAMLEGDFVESRKKSIKLEGVSYHTMSIILHLLDNEDYFVKSEEDLLLVLSAVCMLQFLRIKEICVDRLAESLNPSNCLTIWLTCEQFNVEPLCQQAKIMSLQDFSLIKDFESILDLTHRQLCFYLSNENLDCNSELEVFHTLMRWWTNNRQNITEDRNDAFQKLLSCVDFNRMPVDDLQIVKADVNISRRPEIVEVLNCVIANKNGDDIQKFKGQVIEKADWFLKSVNRASSSHSSVVAED